MLLRAHFGLPLIIVADIDPDGKKKVEIHGGHQSA